MPLSVLVTGANRGIGLELVRQLLAAGTVAGHETSADGRRRTIFATYRSRAESEELFDLAEKSEDAVRPIQLDVCDESSYPRVVGQVSSVVGGNGLNVLVHNAGTLKRPGDLASSSKQDLLNTYEINAVAPVLLTRAFLPLLQTAAQSEHGPADFSWVRSSVVIISALWGSPSFNTLGGIPYAYGMSKAAVNFATKSLSIDLKPHKILTVALHPGWVKTQMGGKEAPIEVVDSVSQMLSVALPKMTADSTGGFFNYDGQLLKY